jgi:hypothetical protein
MHTMDEACAYLAYRFERVVGHETIISTHYTGDTYAPSVRFVNDFCQCGDASCPSEEVTVLNADYVDAALTVSFVPQTVGVYKLCLADEPSADVGKYTKMLLTLEVTPGACAFDVYEASPCAASVCMDEEFMSEECMQLVAEYCASHSYDLACALVAPFFERTIDEATMISLHGSGLTSALDVKFVPEECDCSGSCFANEVEVLSVAYEASMGFAIVEFKPWLRKRSRCAMRRRACSARWRSGQER